MASKKTATGDRIAGESTAGERAGPDSVDVSGPTGLERAIRAHYASLPESERRIADLILEFPGDVAAYTATELADLSNGSKAAVTRLIQRLGFSSYDEARRAARDAQTWGSPLYLMQKSAPPNDFSRRVQEQIKQDSQNITHTLESLGPDMIRDIVSALCSSRHVYCLGWRNSYFLAGYLHWQLVQVRSDVILMPHPGATLAEGIAGLTEADLLVCVGMRRRVPQMGPVMDEAHRKGAKILYVTDRAAAPVANATWTIPCAVRGSDPFDRYCAALSLFHFLSVFVLDEMGQKGRDHLQAIERSHDTFKELE